MNDDGTIAETIVELGIADDNYVQVKSGLKLNDKVQITTELTESTKSSSQSSGFGGSGMPGGGSFPSGDMPNFDSSKFKESGESRPNSMPSGKSNSGK